MYIYAVCVYNVINTPIKVKNSEWLQKFDLKMSQLLSY